MLVMTVQVIVFDVNETVSDLGGMADRFEEVGASRALAATWFASVLRDGFALSSVGDPHPFAAIAESVLRSVLTDASSTVPVDEAVPRIMRGFTSLSVHPDIPDGVRGLAGAGHRLVTLSNGSASVAEKLLGDAGLRDHFEALLSVEDAPAWKPDPRAYELAVSRCGVDAADCMLVAVHPWDIDGAHRAGMATAWVNRTGVPYPSVFHTPDVTVTALTELPEALASRR